MVHLKDIFCLNKKCLGRIRNLTLSAIKRLERQGWSMHPFEFLCINKINHTHTHTHIHTLQIRNIFIYMYKKICCEYFMIFSLTLPSSSIQPTDKFVTKILKIHCTLLSRRRVREITHISLDHTEINIKKI